MITGSKLRQQFRKSLAWQIFRRLMFAKHSGTCQLCERQYKNMGDLHIHHRYETNYENLAEDRFYLLCKMCHEFIHAKYNAPAFKHLGWFGLED